jgi:hypothetical protein
LRRIEAKRVAMGNGTSERRNFFRATRDGAG